MLVVSAVVVVTIGRIDTLPVKPLVGSVSDTVGGVSCACRASCRRLSGKCALQTPASVANAIMYKWEAERPPCAPVCRGRLLLTVMAEALCPKLENEYTFRPKVTYKTRYPKSFARSQIPGYSVDGSTKQERACGIDQRVSLSACGAATPCITCLEITFRLRISNLESGENK